MTALNSEPFPRGALIAAAALVGLSLISTAAVRLARLAAPPTMPIAAEPPALSADLVFSDRADGAIVVQTGARKLVATLQPGTNGFVRGVMRGLARDRISRHIGEAPPFRLSQARDGRLSLQDTATGRLIDLESFGVSNRAAFLDLLHSAEARS
ncbi:MAG: photosynthetic complex assembly protein PuhC [Caulobacteraceae bacterium]